ncbi:hypothetical protein AYI70_g9989, partial [Smittium culicis]
MFRASALGRKLAGSSLAPSKSFLKPLTSNHFKFPSNSNSAFALLSSKRSYATKLDNLELNQTNVYAQRATPLNSLPDIYAG